MTDIDLHARLQEMRVFLEGCWASWAKEKNRPENATGKNMCRFTAVFLAAVLGNKWRIAGGSAILGKHPDDVEVGGFFDGTQWHGHYWVTDGKRIIDLTADQFGAEPILITTVEDKRYDANYSALELLDAMVFVSARANEWAAEFVRIEAAEAALTN